MREVEGLRPTTDRIKETLFNWLAAEVRDSRCLDLFAGSGSLGFEALSRYARHVTMVEMDKGAALVEQEPVDVTESAGNGYPAGCSVVAG